MSKSQIWRSGLDASTEHFLEVGVRTGLVKRENGKIRYIAPNKAYDIDDPEEEVRCSVYVRLISEYEYPKNRIGLEIYPPSRSPPYPADLVVYEDDDCNRPFIVAEFKAMAVPEQIRVALSEGLGNSNLLNAKIMVVVCGTDQFAYDVSSRPSLKTLEKCRIADIPRRYGTIPKYKYKREGGQFFDLQKADFNELRTRFQACHDEIWEGGRRDPAESFDEMSKLMFAKINDERLTRNQEYYKFQIGTHEDPRTVGQRVGALYREAQNKEPGVFIGEIKITDLIVYNVVSLLQDISLLQTDLDAKGRAFEHFLGEIFRGRLGQYFTRREIVEFIVSAVSPTQRDIVIDPACGSGGFLLYCMQEVREDLERGYSGDTETIRRLQYDFAQNQVFGIEVNDRIARVAMMDMVIHDDGHSNIECNNALADYKTFDSRRMIRAGKYTLVLTNPPFGATEKSAAILKQFELGSKSKPRTAQKTEILFIERCIDLADEDARIAIVVPDGILSNPSLQYVRDFVLAHTRILGVVSLPQFAFIPSGSGVKASLLFLQKKKAGERDTPYDIFMAIAEHIGYDATGRRDSNDLPAILGPFRDHIKGVVK
jgi:type I restriction enzyme M protein